MHNLTSSKKSYFKQLDGLRCLAVIFVLLSHWLYIPFIRVIPLGPMGVDTFFVLSGFLITRILLLDKNESAGKSILPPVKKFYTRRFLRIFPIYYLTIIFLLAIHFPGVKENVFWLFSYTFNLRSSSTHWMGLGHLWSLNVEEQFYIFFPFLVFFVPMKKMKLFFYGLIIIGILCRLFLDITNATPDYMYVLTPCCLDSLGMGALLAYYFIYETDTLKKILARGYLFIGALILFIVLTAYLDLYAKGYIEDRTVLQRFLFSIVCFWVIGHAVSGGFKGFFKSLLENKVVVFTGKISYGIYIYHYLAFDLLSTYIDPFLIKHFQVNKTFLLNSAYTHNNMLFATLFLFAFTLCMASLSWYLIELPVIKLKRSLS